MFIMWLISVSPNLKEFSTSKHANTYIEKDGLDR